MLRRNVSHWFVFLGAALLFFGTAPTAEAQLPRERFKQRLAPPAACPCPDSGVVNHAASDPYARQAMYVTTNYNVCGTCSYHYDELAQVWRYDAKNCINGCECVLPAVTRVGGVKIVTSCTKAALSETEFRLQLQVAQSEFHTLRFRLPNNNPNSFQYELTANGKKWQVAVFYKQQAIACAATPFEFPFDLSSTLTTSDNVSRTHQHNEMNSNCVAYDLGDLKVTITLAE
ncbi:MAG: hypothetical protein Q8M16_08290 [Pirellulaceae bacterium]|nr:hypothetical protein [Pirellulaceae bacterium]